MGRYFAKWKYGVCAAALMLTPVLTGSSVLPAQAEQSSFPGGVTAGAEVSLLKPYQSEHSPTGFGYDPATLLWLGYQGSNGLGIRGRWWQYNGKSSSTTSTYNKFKMQTFDLEATKAFTLGSVMGLVFGGFRFASYREDRSFGSVKVPSAYGLETGIELRKPIFGGFSLFGEGRQSLMFDGSWNDQGTSRKNIAFTISELNLGLEYSYPLMQSGLDFYGRIAGQAQYWGGVGDGDSESTGLFGASFMVGIRTGGSSYASGETGMGSKTPGSITAGAEVSLLKPFQSEHSPTGFGFDPATLVWLGYQGSDGLGIRGRWWQYNENSSNSTSNYTKFKMQTIDIEATQSFNLGSMKGLASGGVRFASYREDRPFGGGVKVPSAYGLVFGAELRKPVGKGFSLFGEGRQSLMFDNSWSDSGTQEKNITYTISELKLGLEYASPLMNSGLDVFGRIAGQAQYWNGISDGDTESTGLLGASLMVGIRTGDSSAGDDTVAAHKYPRGVSSGVEVSLLKPFTTEGQAKGFGYDPATLVWAAYQHDNGLGFRGRWWRYNEKSSDATSRYNKLKMQTIDLEMTQAFMVGSVKGLVSGGVRLAKYREEDANVLEVPSAYGLVAGLELQRNLVGGLSVFGEGRYALMFDGGWNDSGTAEKNISFTISEAKVGLRYDQPIWNNRANLFGKISGAAQYWNGVSDRDTESTGLFGAAFELGLKVDF